MILALAGLALSAFLAATPLPMNSELVFLALLGHGHAPLALVVTASIANVLGSLTTYACGRWAYQLHGSRWFPFTAAQLARAQAWFHRWGYAALLLSWAPGGDFLVALAGLMRLPLLSFLILVSIAKTLRYAVLAWAGAGFGQWLFGG